MKNKVLAFAIAFVCAFTNASAQDSEGIQFVEGKTFAEAVALAKESGKKIFLDCYTSWCGPCKMMASKIFPQKAAGEYFNAEFVNIKIDMEKGEGPELAKQFKIRAYPTFIMFDNNGKEIGRLVGSSQTAEAFVASVKNAVGEDNLAALNEKYDKGERSIEFLTKYLTVLSAAYETGKAQQVASEILEGKTSELMDNAALFQTFIQYNSSPLSPSFQYVLDHKDEFKAKYPDSKLDRMMASTWMTYPRTLLKKNEDGTISFDKEGMKLFTKEMKKRDVKNRNEIVLLSDINVAEASKDWSKYAKLCSKYIKNHGESDMYIYNWALRIHQNCKDQKVKNTAIGWMQKRINSIKEEEAKLPPLKEGEIRPMAMTNFTKTFEDLINKMK